MRKSITLAVGGFMFLGGGCADADLEDPAPAGGNDTPSVVQGALSGRKGGDDRGGGGRVRCPTDLPAALNPPPDATIAEALAATGVQIYTCTVPAGGGTPVFALKAPHAVLHEGSDTKAIHFAGPSWQALDGSLVTATRLASAAAPDPTAIPWLLLQAASHVGAGVFADVTFIQRLDTVGGVAPTTGCDDAHIGSEVLVPYRANYFFYQTAVCGSRVHRCGSP
jgi:hypothetical protein